MISDIDTFDDWRSDALRWASAFCLVLALHGGIAVAVLSHTDNILAPPAPPALMMVDLPVDAILPTADSVESVAAQAVAEIAPSEMAEPIETDELVEEIVEDERPPEAVEEPVETVQTPPELTRTVTVQPVEDVVPLETPAEELPEPLEEVVERSVEAPEPAREPLFETPPERLSEVTPTESRPLEKPTIRTEEIRPEQVNESEAAVAEPINPTEAVTAKTVVEPPKPKPNPTPNKSVPEKKQGTKKKAATKKPAPAQAASKGSISSRAAAGAGRSNPQELARYLSRVRAMILRHRRSVRSGARGQVVVRVVINGSGRLTGIKVVRSSGQRDLDKAALDVVRRVGRVPAIPAGVRRSSIPLNVPFRFSGR